jgi:sugar phosphate isomerase/epimerase
MSALALAAGRFSSAEKLYPIGLQLYTVRSLLPRDFDGTLAKIAAIGYQEVEFAGYFGRRPAQVRDSVKNAGLAAPSTHLAFEQLGEAWPGVLHDSKTIGHEYVIVPSIPDKARQTLDDYRRIADRFNEAGKAAQDVGLTFGYHNHAFEFERIEGKLPYDVLLERTDPELVKFQMDLYWISIGGQNPVDYFARWPGRFPMVHVKDLVRAAPGRPARMVDVGAGDLYWKAIFAKRRQAGMFHYFIEHDEPADPLLSIRKSYEYLSRLEV